jgi:nucleoside-diphosphate-sugar epimerase
MKVLVTGGAGYVGSTLVPLLLDRGCEVCVLDCLAFGGESLLGPWGHPHFSFVHGDIRDHSAVKAALSGCDAVVHLAAIVGDPACSRQPDMARVVNLDSSLFLIEESKERGVQRFVFASTCSNYGRMRDADTFVNEETELRPVSLYAETKVSVEEELLKSGRNGWCPTPLRFATVYGVSPRMRFDLTVNEFTAELLTQKYLRVFGEQFWRPYVHVLDAARAIQMVLSSPESLVAGQVFNVGSTDENFQKKQLVDMICSLAPDAVVEYVHKDEDPRDYRVSFERIKKQIGYRTTRTVAQGINEVAELVKKRVIQNFNDARYRN